MVAALVFFALVPSLSFAQERTSFSFAPQPPDRCDYFLITEASVNVVDVEVPHGHSTDRFLYTDSFGFMKNIGRFALGVPIDAHLTKATSTQTHVKFAPTVRFKRWFAGKQSLDLLVGYVPKGKGVVGGLDRNPAVQPTHDLPSPSRGLPAPRDRAGAGEPSQ